MCLPSDEPPIELPLDALTFPITNFTFSYNGNLIDDIDSFLDEMEVEEGSESDEEFEAYYNLPFPKRFKGE